MMYIFLLKIEDSTNHEKSFPFFVPFGSLRSPKGVCGISRPSFGGPSRAHLKGWPRSFHKPDFPFRKKDFPFQKNNPISIEQIRKK